MYLRILFPLLSLALLLPAGVVAVVDPYHFWHDSRANPDLYSLNQRYQNAGIIRRFVECADCSDVAIIVGTSMSENTSREDLQVISGNEQSVRLIAEGSYPAEQDYFLRRALASGNVTKVYWEVYRNFVREDYDQPPQPGAFPEYMYNQSVLDDYRYFFNHTVVLDSLTARPGVPGWSADLETLNNWHQRALDSDRYRNWSAAKSRALQTRLVAPRIAKWDGTQPDWSRAVPVFERYIKPLIEGYPAVDFYLYVPPVSLIRQGEDMGDLLSGQMALRLKLAEFAEQTANLEFFVFDHYEPLVADMAYYKDSAHYLPAVSRWLLERIAAHDERFVGTPDNVVQWGEWVWQSAIYNQPSSSCADEPDLCGVFDPRKH